MHNFLVGNDSETEDACTSLQLFLSRRPEDPTIVTESLLYEELEKLAPVKCVAAGDAADSGGQERRQHLGGEGGLRAEHGLESRPEEPLRQEAARRDRRVRPSTHRSRRRERLRDAQGESEKYSPLTQTRRGRSRSAKTTSAWSRAPESTAASASYRTTPTSSAVCSASSAKTSA